MTTAVPPGLGAMTDRSHHCPRCGAGEWRVVESFNPNGTHTHRCGTCGTAFTH